MALSEPAHFDRFALGYDVALNQGLAISGEDKLFFARGRIAWLASCLKKLGVAPASVIDYGCGTGSSIPLLYELLPVRSAVGLDVSPQSLEVARRQYQSLGAQFFRCEDYPGNKPVDLVFCNGVFHHIPLDQRAEAVGAIFTMLRPGGLFAFWENNPFNPGTRYVMSKIPFDRDAITLTAGEARGLLHHAGLNIVRTDYCFIFPKMLKAFRCTERWLTKLPLGAQYQVLCRKPSSHE